MLGVFRRREQFFDISSKRTVLLPLDHGVTEGVLNGLERLDKLFPLLGDLGLNGVIVHKGIAKEWGKFLPLNVKLIVHLSAGSKHGLPPYNKTIVCSVAEALRLGADAVSVHINIGNDLEDKMLQDFGLIVDEAHQFGLPVLAMIYARGGQIVNEFDPSLIAHCIRLGAELGADLIKVPYSGDKKSFTKAVDSCPVPVLIAGGPKKSTFKDFLAMVQQALDTGIRGVSIGRNVFQQKNCLEALRKLVKMVKS
ncbi:class I fructose-bisphosphate aldolase [Desulfonauticus submarinus]